jgi:cell division topological specificity factor
MLDAIKRFFSDRKSGKVARDRMQIVLLHDRLSIEPEVMEKIKNEIIAVLSKYMEIDHQTINVRVEQGKDYAALVSNVHVKRVLRHGQAQSTNAQ